MNLTISTLNVNIDRSVELPTLGSSFCCKLQSGIHFLFELFRGTIEKCSCNRTCFAPLIDRDVCVGGVENIGYSCVISALLQEWAAFPAHFDPLLEEPLQQREGEASSLFQSRVALQCALQRSVHCLRRGELVKRREVHELSRLLENLDCYGEELKGLYGMLHQALPEIFIRPPCSPYTLNERVLALFSAPIDPTVIRIATRYDQEVVPRERLHRDNRDFHLKMVHVVEERTLGKHVSLYRRLGDRWIYCDDKKVSSVDTLPQAQIYELIYASHI